MPAAPVPRVTRTRASWSSDLEWGLARLEVQTSGNGNMTITATRGWMDEADTEGIPIPDLAELPDFSEAFIQVLPNNDFTFYAERGDRAGTFSSCSTSGLISP